MIATNHQDKDGFRLQFEENTPESEREFYMKMFPTVDTVAKNRIHCTVCDVHIGTAPLAEKIIRTHPCLGVTHCNKCFAFYNSGEFGKGEDGSEYYCRWCGQGGEVYCCSQCPFVFCSKCIKLNLSAEMVEEIENNEDWPCFVCAPKAIWHLKAQQWALQNYIDKQTQKIKDMNLISEGEINYLLSRDSSTCCQKKRIEIKKPIAPPVKRKSTNGIQLPMAKKPAPAGRSVNGTSASPGKSDELVCTPDIFSMFEQEEQQNAQAAQTTLPKTTTIRPIRITTPSTAPPPLAIRQNTGLPRVRFPQTTTTRMQGTAGGTVPPSPVYHTIGGFRIDLNHAARQEIFRLPNGKLIQVRKQVTNAPTATTNQASPISQPVPVGVPTRVVTPNAMRPNLVNRAVRPSGVNSRFQRPQVPVQGQMQARFLISDATPSQIAASQLNSVGAAPAATVPASPGVTSQLAPITQTGTTIFQQQNGSIIVNRAQHPDTIFGKSKTGFEDKIISGMEICQHTINKMITLTNSTSFKSSKNFQDLKELYIHLKYLYSFTIGKFTTLQEKLSEDMEKLAENDPQLNKNDDDDDDLEIVEKQHECIEVDDSDDEAKDASKKKTPRKQTLQPKEIPDTPEKIEVAPDLPMSFIPMLMTEDNSRPTSACSFASSINDISNDPKLMKDVIIKAEKLEERYPYINKFLDTIKEGEKETVRVKLAPVGDEDCYVLEPENKESDDEEEEEDQEESEVSTENQDGAQEPLASEENKEESEKNKENPEEKADHIQDGAETVEKPVTVEIDDDEPQTINLDDSGEDKAEKEDVQEEISKISDAGDAEMAEESQEKEESPVENGDVMKTQEEQEKLTEDQEKAVESPENIEKLVEDQEKPEEPEVQEEKPDEIPEISEIQEKFDDNIEKLDENLEKLDEIPLNLEELEAPAKPVEESTEMDFQPTLDLPEASELLAENGMGEINDFDADDLLNTVGHGDDNLDLPDLDEKLEKEVDDISNQLLEPMETD